MSVMEHNITTRGFSFFLLTIVLVAEMRLGVLGGRSAKDILYLGLCLALWGLSGEG